MKDIIVFIIGGLFLSAMFFLLSVKTLARLNYQYLIEDHSSMVSFLFIVALGLFFLVMLYFSNE